ncbi:N-6 DNA methylase [Janthinobacterium lividum]
MDRNLKIDDPIITASDALRSLIPSSEHKYYILPILFLRLLYDYIEISRDNFEIIINKEKFNTVQSRIFTFFNCNEKETLYGIFDAVEKCFPDKLTSVFSTFKFSTDRLGSKEQQKLALENIVKTFARPPFSFSSFCESKKSLGEIFKSSIALLALHSKGEVEYLTPPEISILISKLVSHNKGMKKNKQYYDPACGSGSLLSTCATMEKERGNGVEIFGQEKNGTAWAIAKLNLFLSEADNATVTLSDSLRSPPVDNHGNLRKFDVAVSNPPWNMKTFGDDILDTDSFQRFTLGAPKSSADYAFILQMLTMLNPQGVMAIVSPNGLLFRSGGDGSIRRNLVEYNLIDAIIALPQKLFYNTTIPANILLFKKDKKESDIFFINWNEAEFFSKGVSRLSPAAIDKIFDLYSHKTELDGISRLVSVAEIHRNEYNLSSNRYIQNEIKKQVVDLISLREEKNGVEVALEEISMRLNQAIIDSDDRNKDRKYSA